MSSFLVIYICVETNYNIDREMMGFEDMGSNNVDLNNISVLTYVPINNYDFFSIIKV